MFYIKGFLMTLGEFPSDLEGDSVERFVDLWNTVAARALLGSIYPIAASSPPSLPPPPNQPLTAPRFIEELQEMKEVKNRLE